MRLSPFQYTCAILQHALCAGLRRGSGKTIKWVCTRAKKVCILRVQMIAVLHSAMSINLFGESRERRGCEGRARLCPGCGWQARHPAKSIRGVIPHCESGEWKDGCRRVAGTRFSRTDCVHAVCSCLFVCFHRSRHHDGKGGTFL